MLDGNFKMCYLDAKYKTENIKSAEKLSTFNTRIFGTDLEQLYVYIVLENSEHIQWNYAKICTLYKKLYDPENCSPWY